MIDISALPLLTRRLKRLPAVRRARPAWTSEGLHRVDVVVPDTERAALLLEYASPLFPAEVVSGSSLTVRLQPPAGAGWVIELLSLVDRWLESTRLPSTTVLYGGRSYLVRAPLDLAHLVEPAAATTPTF
ncbi:MAG TPA: hypothetical protein VJ986_13180 [Gaiellaceae bacterium]|nr:hypothetical protein [Gaiellaceae bacterium]